MARDKLEYQIQRKLVRLLKIRGWLVQRMSADAFQNGFPDLFCAHKTWGKRWVEAKQPEGYTLTQAQRRKWALWGELGIGIWILTAATQEEYDKLYKPPNWRDFCKDSLRVPAREGIHATLDELCHGHEELQKANKEARGKPTTNGMSRDKPERQIQDELVEFLKIRQWHVEPISADAYQNGIPDLFCANKELGTRWVEVKRPTGYTFTLRQSQRWPEWDKFGIGIWILTAATQEEYDKLFKPPNWRDFWKEEFRVPTQEDIDAMLDDLRREDEPYQFTIMEGRTIDNAERRSTPG
jgi:Holliday junction resolvase